MTKGRELRIDGVGRSTLKKNEAIVVLIQHPPMSKPPLKMYPTVGEFYENGENEYIKTFLPPHDNFKGRELRIDGVGRSTLKQNEAIVVLIQHHQQLMSNEVELQENDKQNSSNDDNGNQTENELKDLNELIKENGNQNNKKQKKKDKEKEKEKRKKDQIENQNLNESKSQLSNRKEQNFAEEKSKPLNSFDFSQTDSATTYNSLYSLPPPFPNHVHTNVGGLPPSDTGLYITLSGFLVMYSVLNFLSFLVPEPNETINKIFSSITTLSLLSAPLFFLIKKKLNLKKVLRLHKGTNDFKIALLSILLTCTLISNLYLISAFTKIISNNIPDFDENTDIKSFGLGLLSFVDVALIPGFCEATDKQSKIIYLILFVISSTIFGITLINFLKRYSISKLEEQYIGIEEDDDEILNNSFTDI
ncbi:adenylate cyclase type 1 [Anaeramoeba flamelloides]|uniref:Adenylate cyclase type 1 n=1 Tax=Anaeramoeba flamelloides TaxID=1746091 RepID=A0ABQ8Z5F0_9EUKA|nr:adenylate cyclase type 1 [Anaeramoeba flamelloides]